MGQNMGLPGGANDWAREVNTAMQTLGQLQEIARRICSDFGLDIANSARGLYTGATPSVDNPVQLKLASFQDLDVRDAQDGDVLAFQASTGKWVARRYAMAQLPKEFPVGDPDSYYTPPPPPVETGIWSSTTAYTNHITDPSFENGTTGWQIANDWYMPDDATNVAQSIEHIPGGKSGSFAMKVTLGFSELISTPAYNAMNWISFPNMPETEDYNYTRISMRYTFPAGGFPTDCYGEMYILNAAGDVIAGGNTPERLSNLNGTWKTLTISDISLENYPAGSTKKILLRFGGNWEGAGMEGGVVELDCFSHSQAPAYFDGDTADTPEFTYGWTGAPNDSTSIATVLKQIQVPESITLGVPFTVNGRGWAPGASVDVYEVDWYAANSIVTVDGDGTFSTTLTIPANTDPDAGPVAGPDIIMASQQGVSEYSPRVNVTLI